MFCGNCGSGMENEQKFCSNCGSVILQKSQISTVPPSIELSDASEERVSNVPTQRKFNKRNKLLGFAGLISLAVFGGIFFLLPNSVEIKLVLKSEDDVTFTQDCKPTIARDSDLKEAIQISFFSSNTDVETEAEYVIAEGSWRPNTSGEGCLFDGSIKIPRNVDSYSAKLITASGTKMIADGLTLDGVADLIELEADVTQYQKVEGKMVLNVSVSPSTYIGCLNRFAFINGGSCGSLSMPSRGKCNGTGGYSDIGSGTVIRVSTNNNQELGIGRLETGTGGTFLDWDRVGDEYETSCTFTWSVDVPRISGDYRFGIGSRGERSYSYQQLQDSSWKVNLSLG